MNNLFKRRGTYYYDFTLNGHRFRGSCKTTDLQTAKVVLVEVQKAAVLGAHGLRTPPTLKTAVEAWVTRKQSSVSPQHLRAASYALQSLKALQSERCDRLTTNAVEAWRSQFLASHSPATTNQVLRYLKAWMKWLVECDEMGEVPFRLKPLRFQKKIKDTLKPDQVLPFFRAVNHGNAKGRALRCAMRVMLATGMREAEILGMRWEWLDTDAKLYWTGKAKGKKTRAIPIPDWAFEPLLVLTRSVNGLIFPGHAQGWLRQAFARVYQQTGLKLSNHRLRASFATMQHALGTPLAEVQALLGHSNISTTMAYVENDLDRKRAAQEILAKGIGLA